MQVKRTETADKPKGMIERNQSVNKLNSETLENKVDASLKHTAESGLKTNGSSVSEGVDGKTRYAEAQRAKIISEEAPDSKPQKSGYDDYYKKQLEEHKDEDVRTENIQSQKPEQRTINTKTSDNTVNTAREQFLHSKQISSSESKNMPHNKKGGDLTEYEVTAEDRATKLYQKDLDRKTKKLLGTGTVEENAGRKIKTSKTSVSDEKSPLLKPDHDNVRKFKYYRSTNGQIQTKVEYNRIIQKRVKPKGVTKFSFRDLNNQRKIKSRNNDILDSFEKDKKAWDNYVADPNAKNAKIYRKAHANYIGALKNKYTPEELANGNFVEFGNKRIRVVSKVNFQGNIDDLKKTIKLDTVGYQKLKRHLRFKKISNASASVLGKMINISAVSLPKATLRSGLNYINTKAKSVNVEDTSDTGVESAKLVYKTASDGRQLATSVKRGIKTSAKTAKNTYKIAREIPGKVKNIPKTARKVATAVKTAPNTAKKTAQNAKKIAKQAQKAAKRMTEAAKKVAKAAEKVAEVTFKAMAKAAAFFVTHLPIILIVVLILLVVFLIIAVVSGMISVVSNTTVGGVSYAIPGDENSKPEEIAETLDHYQDVIDSGLDNIKEQQIAKASGFLSANDDFYAAFTSNGSGDWIKYSGGAGEASVRNILDNIEIDYAEFYALLYVYMQKQKNLSDGNNSNDVYSFTFSDADLQDFLDKYFDVSYTEATGVECPGKNCKTKYCSPGCQTEYRYKYITKEDGTRVRVRYTYRYCPGHPYCDKHHKKATISITKNSNIMDDLGFTDGEKQWKDMIEQLYDEYIMNYILNGGSTS